MVGQVERDREVNLFNETTIYYYLVYITFTNSRSNEKIAWKRM